MNTLVHGYRCEPIFGGDPLAFSGNFGGSDDCPLVLRGENLALNLWKDIGDTAKTESMASARVHAP